MATTRDLIHTPVREAATGFDVRKIREDFPFLKQKVYGKPLVYLDNAATSQKPQVVLDASALRSPWEPAATPAAASRDRS